VRTEDLPEEIASRLRSGGAAIGAAPEPALKADNLRRVLLPWLLIRLILAVIGWFRRTDARNLGQLIGTVLLSLAYSPKQWLASAIDQTEQAWSDLSQLPVHAHWNKQPILCYGFGHSLGGLLSLSLPDGRAARESASALQPQLILTADPATSTEMAFPDWRSGC
jgi:hypothetical protein